MHISYPRCLSGNLLKLLAAVFMTIDHAGMLLFPQQRIFRIIGRLAMPIFAYMIAEGCHYTRNRKKYFGTIFGLGVLFQLVYAFFDPSTYLSIFITFSLSILMVYALQYWAQEKTMGRFALFCLSVAGVYGLNRVLTIDYGFWGCMLPVFAALPRAAGDDRPAAAVTAMGVGMILLALDGSSIQMYSLLSLPLLYAYNGQRGKWRMKYFYYIFYPAHLVILQAIAWLIN